jgi:hypothetical protein
VQASEQRPIVVTVIPSTPAKETTVADVIVGALGVTGALVALALALGVVVAVLRVGWNRLHPPIGDHLPPVTPGVSGPPRPPSSRAQ